MTNTGTEPKSTLATRLSQYQKLLHEIQELSLFGELTDEQAQELVDRQTDITVKMDAIDYVLGELDASEKQLLEQAKVFQNAAYSRRKAAERLRDYVKYRLEQSGEKSIQGSSCEYRLQRAKPSVVIEDEAAVPERFVILKTTQSFDKAAIKEAIEKFEDVPGARLEESKTLVRRVRS